MTVIDRYDRGNCRHTEHQRAESRLPVWASAVIILALSGVSYWLLFLLVHWLLF